MSVGPNWKSHCRQRRFYEQLFPHRDGLYRYALRLTENRADAEDLVQEALIKAFDALDRAPKSSNYRGWLYTILRNTWLSIKRREGRVQFTDSPPERVLPGHTPHELLEAGRGQRAKDRFEDEVQNALSHLPEHQRSAVLLSDVERLQYQEIADLMNCPVGTVRSRIFHARQALRRALRKYAARAGILRNQRLSALSKT